ncbi:MAG TPA: RNA polymerase sigma factor [Ktedonobacteraceae bacterium]|nr:RNA polymerase sigma factor [Ktedonobacteraceae bacterium]
MFQTIQGDSFDELARENAAHLGDPTSAPDRTGEERASMAQVVGQARAGDSQAFSALFQHYNSQICTYLARLVGNDEVGRDLAQETFLRAWQSLPAIRSDEHFKPWLFRIAINAAKSHLRQARRVLWLPWQDNESTEASLAQARLEVAGPEERTGETECVQKALAHVAPQSRACLLLQLVAGFSQREVAQTLGISEKSVSAYVSRGRERFRREYRRLKGAAE